MSGLDFFKKVNKNFREAYLFLQGDNKIIFFIKIS